MGEVVQIKQDGLSPSVIEWFKKRGISEQTLIRTKIYNTRQRLNGVDHNVIVFPFLSDGKVVNEKYRNAQKEIWQSRGGEKVFWNDDIIDHPDLQSGKNSLVITEGEIDALSFIETGYPFVVSVPNGAPPPSDEPIVVPEEDTNYSYITKAWNRLKGIKRIILATDADPPGKRLQRELAVRLGESRCYTVSYPEECKDANDVMVKYGVERVYDLICDPTPFPIYGLYKASNLPPEPAIEPLSTGWGRLDEFLMVAAPAFMVVTGKPNEGKSTWVNQLAAQLALKHSWNITIASFEGMIQPFLTGQLRAVHAEQAPRGDTEEWLQEHFNFIVAKGDDENYDTYDLDWLLDKAVAACVRYNTKVLIIDPWNEIEHTFYKSETQTDYISRAIRRLKRFAYQYGVLVIVVAHPTKGASDKKKSEEIELYDIADSAHWHNKADFGVTVARIGQNSYETNIYVRKVRNQPRFGKRGYINITFSPYYGTFSL